MNRYVLSIVFVSGSKKRFEKRSVEPLVIELDSVDPVSILKLFLRINKVYSSIYTALRSIAASVTITSFQDCSSIILDI